MQWLTTKFIHRHNCQNGEGEVDNSDNNGLQQRDIRAGPQRFEHFRRVVQHHIDADKLLKDGEHNADYNHAHAKHQQTTTGFAAMIQGVFNFLYCLSCNRVAHNFAQDTFRLFLLAARHQPARTFWHGIQQH